MNTKQIVPVILLVLCLTLSLAPARTYSAENMWLSDPLFGGGSVWNNAWTETFYGNGTPPFKTVVYSRPQMVWNGTKWVKYEIKPINEMGVVLKTPTCAYLVGGTGVLLFRPLDIESSMARMEWIVEKYSVTLEDWVQEELSEVNVGYNGTHVWQTRILEDGSTRTLYINCDNKQEIVFTSVAAGTYRIVWHLIDIPASKATFPNKESIELERCLEDEYSDFNFSKLVLWNGNRFSLLVDYEDIGQSYYRKCVLGSSEEGFAYATLVYGNWTLNTGECLIVDPETETFTCEAPLDGWILKTGSSYPPNDNTYVETEGNNIYVGQAYPQSLYYATYRGYVSFNTSEIKDYADITSAVLKLKTSGDSSLQDFIMNVLGGAQPIYGSSLEADDWGCGSTEVATWSSAYYPGTGIYVNITIPTDQVNKQGRTQFELKSNREGQAPQSMTPEYVAFYSAEPEGNEPQLEIMWNVTQINVVGQGWFCFNSTSKKAAILLFGGSAYGNDEFGIIVKPYTHQAELELIEALIDDLYVNGFDIYTNIEQLRYKTANQDQVYNLAMYLLNRGYSHLFLYGHSAGGMVVAYEIQKNYSSIYSAAIIASALVDCGHGPMHHSAQTADKVKTCTSFICGINDTAPEYCGFKINIYAQLSTYFNNTYVHKEWHTWNSGHSIYGHECLTHPCETLSEAMINWYEKHSVILKNPSFEDRSRSVFGSAHWHANSPGWRELRADIDGDGECYLTDLDLFGRSWFKKVGDVDYDWRADFDGDGEVYLSDLNIFNEDWSESATRFDGGYSWFADGRGSCRIEQWLNSSTTLIQGKSLNFSFHFLPKRIYVNQTEVQVRGEIYYINDTGEYWVNGSWFHPTSNTTWYTLSVATTLPENLTAVKVVIHGKPGFEAWIDLTTLEISEP